jgi:hypothetical protein
MRHHDERSGDAPVAAGYPRRPGAGFPAQFSPVVFTQVSATGDEASLRVCLIRKPRSSSSFSSSVFWGFEDEDDDENEEESDRRAADDEKNWPCRRRADNMGKPKTP